MAGTVEYTGEPGKDIILLKKPNAAWGGAGLNTEEQAIRFVDEEGEDRARIDGRGGIGCQALHVSPGTNMEGTFIGTQAAWLQPLIDIPGLIIDNPPATDPDGQPLTATKNYLACRDVHSVPAKVVFRVSPSGYIMSRKNVAPSDAELAVGEFCGWFDPAAGTFKLTGKKNDGSVVTKSLSA